MNSKESLPRIFQVIDDFIELKNKDLMLYSYEDLKEEWDKKIARYIDTFYTNVNHGQSNHVFRARRITPEIIVPLGSLGYPPIDKCERNRCNWKGHPVLYTSDYPGTALYECQPRKGDLFYLTSWKITDLSKLRIIPFLYN